MKGLYAFLLLNVLFLLLGITLIFKLMMEIGNGIYIFGFYQSFDSIIIDKENEFELELEENFHYSVSMSKHNGELRINENQKKQLPFSKRLSTKNWPKQIFSENASIKLNNVRITKKEQLKILSQIVFDLINEVQKKTNSEGCKYPVTCSYNIESEFSAQIHHAVLCILTGFYLRVPLTINFKPSWKNFYLPWEEFFSPIEGKCEENLKDKLRLKWPSKQLINLLRFYGNSDLEAENLGFTYKEGIPIPQELAKHVEKVHSTPFVWFIGVFSKYLMRQNDKTKIKIKRDKRSIGFKLFAYSPIVGVHVDLHRKNETDLYIYYAQEFFLKYEMENHKIHGPWKIFVSNSDDPRVLSDFKSKLDQKRWKVLGFNSNTDTNTQHTNKGKNQLYPNIRDIFTLNDCDYIICGFTSQICRLVFEMKSVLEPDPEKVLKNIDLDENKYAYGFGTHDKILKF